MPRGFGGEAGAGLRGWEAELFLGREGEDVGRAMNEIDLGDPAVRARS